MGSSAGSGLRQGVMEVLIGCQLRGREAIGGEPDNIILLEI